MKNFKYKSVFSNCIVKASVSSESMSISEASIEDLKNIDIPESIDLEKNPDLLFTVFNGAVINRVNRNGDGIDRKTAMAIKESFLHKPVNIEHEKERIVGHIVQVGWSSYGDNKLLTDEEVSEMDEPFNLVIGAVVYRVNAEEFSNILIDSVEEDSPNYNKIHSSWEIGYDKYKIIVGSKNVSEGTVLEAEEDIKKYSKYLAANGGGGKTPDGQFVGRLIFGDETSVLPLGFGYVANPAAEVEGVTIVSPSHLTEDEEDDESSEAKRTALDVKLEILSKVFKKNLK